MIKENRLLNLSKTSSNLHPKMWRYFNYKYYVEKRFREKLFLEVEGEVQVCCESFKFKKKEI